jgi:hypothetical protein
VVRSSLPYPAPSNERHSFCSRPVLNPGPVLGLFRGYAKVIKIVLVEEIGVTVWKSQPCAPPSLTGRLAMHPFCDLLDSVDGLCPAGRRSGTRPAGHCGPRTCRSSEELRASTTPDGFRWITRAFVTSDSEPGRTFLPAGSALIRLVVGARLRSWQVSF